MKVDSSTVEKIGELIRIEINDAEAAKISEQLSSVLKAVEVLGELNTDGIRETSQTHGLENVLRSDDIVTPGLDMSNYQNRKNFKNGYFIVLKK